jgi:hypothetical protein
MSADAAPIYQLKATLRDIQPPVWRRIQIYQHATFHQLHLTLQTAMGWWNVHLYEFRVGAVQIVEPAILESWGEEGPDPLQTRLLDYVRDDNARFSYEYDFGDSWLHQLVLEKRLPAEPGAFYPRCIKGKRACPPEDVGGTGGYQRFLEIMADPGRPDHEQYRNWVGGSFDPEAFSLDRVNERLRTGIVSAGTRVDPPLASRPRFTAAAARQWAAVPEQAQQQILANVWCGHCGRETTIVDYEGQVRRRDLVLQGHCIRCGGVVSRLVEGG